MSRKGNPYDNALAESFVATLKTECFGDSVAPTKADAKLMVFDYIETFYNTRRRHSALDYRSPAQFEHHWLCSQREGCSGGGSLGGETCLTEQVGSAAQAVNNSQELFKPPETTRSNHQRAFNAAYKPLTSAKKQESSPCFRRKIKSTAGQQNQTGRIWQFFNAIPFHFHSFATRLNPNQHKHAENQ
jgi:Integrase core domain